MSELNLPAIYSQMSINVKDHRDIATSKSGSDDSAQSPKLERDSSIQSPFDVRMPERSYSEDSEAHRLELPGAKKVWTQEEEESLIQLHNSIGNCWTQIATKLSKDHNTVKNHFYAEIRKSVRRINFFILLHFPKQHKELNLAQISKAITILSEKKREIPNLSGLNIFPDAQINNLKFEMFKFAKFSENDVLSEDERGKFEAFLDEINQILAELKNRGLIGKKNSAFKQARQAKLKKEQENQAKKAIRPRKLSEPARIGKPSCQTVKSEEKEMINELTLANIFEQRERATTCQHFINHFNPHLWSNYCMPYPYNYPYMMDNNTMSNWFNPLPYFSDSSQAPNQQTTIFSGINSSFSLCRSNQNNFS